MRTTDLGIFGTEQRKKGGRRLCLSRAGEETLFMLDRDREEGVHTGSEGPPKFVYADGSVYDINTTGRLVVDSFLGSVIQPTVRL